MPNYTVSNGPEQLTPAQRVVWTGDTTKGALPVTNPDGTSIAGGGGGGSQYADQALPGTPLANLIAFYTGSLVQFVNGSNGLPVNIVGGTLNESLGKTLLSAGGLASASGNNTLVVAGVNRLKVYAFSLSTLSTTAVTCIFQSGASGAELWRVVLQAPTGISTGANLVVSPPAWLFATAGATLLNLNLSSAQPVNWSVSYYDEA